MKIKSLLLGSAAALVAVSGARAADAIVVEAEPMEYVKVCDMYGAGYFYIPGTETCLKLGGNVRFYYEANHDHADGNISDHNWNARLRFTIDAKNETEYGTLSSAARVAFQRGGSAYDVDATDAVNHDDVFSFSEGHSQSEGLDYATINLAGFTVGYGDSRLSVGQFGSSMTEKAVFADYTYSAGDIALTVGIQDTPDSGYAGQPDVYGVLSYNGEGFDMKAYGVMDTSADGFAYGVIANVDLSSFVPGGKFRAFWEGDDYDNTAACVASVVAVTAPNGTADACGGTDYVKGHVWGVRMDYKLTDSLSAYTRYSEHSDGNRAARQSVSWAVASGLTVEGQYNKDIDAGTGKYSIEITRSF